MKKIRIVDKTRTEYNFEDNEMIYIENGNEINRNKLMEFRSGPFLITRK